MRQTSVIGTALPVSATHQSRLDNARLSLQAVRCDVKVSFGNDNVIATILLLEDRSGNPVGTIAVQCSKCSDILLHNVRLEIGSKKVDRSGFKRENPI